MAASRAFSLVAGLLVLGLLAYLFVPRTRAEESGEPGRIETSETARSEEVDTASSGSSTRELAGGVREPDASSSATQPSIAGQLLVRARWPGGEPASGVRILLRRAERRLPRTVLASHVTDAAGEVRFADLPRGELQLLSDRLDVAKVRIEGGEQVFVFELAGGIHVTGRVLSPAGVPVGGASIWLQTQRGDRFGGRIVGVADETGSFELAQIPGTLSLAALARGYEASELLDLELAKVVNDRARIELRLRPGGSRITGTVRDVRARPIPGATVAFGSRRTHFPREGGRTVEAWGLRCAVTDAEGRFELFGLEEGTHPLCAHAERHGIDRREITLAPGQLRTVQIVLLDASALHGRVTGASGEALAGAVVRVYDREPSTQFIAGGQIDFDEAFGYSGVRTDASGHYRLEGLTPGSAHIFLFRSTERTPGRSMIFRYDELELPAGGERRFDAQLTAGHQIEGIVRFQGGKPMPGVFVTLQDESTSRRYVQTNDREGRFTFSCLPASTFTVHVQYWNAPKGTPRLEKSGVHPDRGVVELIAPFDAPEKKKRGNVRGRVDDVAGRIQNPRAAHVVLMSDQGWFRDDGKLTDGRFEMKGLQPCRFRLMLMEGQNAIAQSDWFELKPGADLDTGVLHTEAAASLVLHLLRRPGTEDTEPRLYLRRDGFARSTRVTPGRAGRVDVPSLTPGRYRLSGHAEGMVSIEQEIDVRLGAANAARVELVAGVLCRIRVWFPEKHGAQNFRYEIRDGRGKKVHGYEGGLHRRSTRPFAISRTLAPGRYTVDYSTGNGLRAKRSFTVESLEQGPELRLDLEKQ